MPLPATESSAIQINETDAIVASASSSDMVAEKYICYSPAFSTRWSRSRPNNRYDNEGDGRTISLLKKWWNAFLRRIVFVDTTQSHYISAFYFPESDQVYTFELDFGKDDTICAGINVFNTWQEFEDEVRCSHRDFIGALRISPKKLCCIAKENELNGKPYHLFTRNCQVWVKYFLDDAEDMKAHRFEKYLKFHPTATPFHMCTVMVILIAILLHTTEGLLVDFSQCSSFHHCLSEIAFFWFSFFIFYCFSVLLVFASRYFYSKGSKRLEHIITFLIGFIGIKFGAEIGKYMAGG